MDAQRSLFSLKSRTFGLGQTNWADKFWGIWGVFGQTISTHFGAASPLSMYSIIQSLFLQKLSLYIHNAKIHLGLGFEFGLQRIRDLAFVFPQSVFSLKQPCKLFNTCFAGYCKTISFLRLRLATSHQYLISNSSDSFTNSVTTNLRIFSTKMNVFIYVNST